MSKAQKKTNVPDPTDEPMNSTPVPTVPVPTVTDRDREVARQLASEATEMASKQFEERKVIERCKGLLTALASIQPEAPGYGPVYHLNRMGQRGKITRSDIERAALCLADRVGKPPHPATVEDCIEALGPLARMPRDPLSEDLTAVQFQFPNGSGKTVDITLGMIRQADALVAQYGE